jgi:NhaA family Na+:H+ antiporter
MNNITFKRKVLLPFKHFISRSSSGGILLMGAAILSLIAANSPLAAYLSAFWDMRIGFSIGNFNVYKPLLLWVNDGLMSVFFFVVGLELKREMLAGELAQPQQAILPCVAGLGGMVAPALVFLWFNAGEPGEALAGWGIPMATDIAFVLGILYLFGDRVPVVLKVFLTALAIIDDIGAILVIAIFYTEEISMLNLMIGSFFLGTMVLGNLAGIRNTLFYAVLGIVGVWLAFLLSGVHATIAAVLAAFTIPANYALDKERYLKKAQLLIKKYNQTPAVAQPLLPHEQYFILHNIKKNTDLAVPPLQRLEHSLHGLVAFIILPIFAFANAGIALSYDLLLSFKSPVTLGIIAGLLGGKVVGITGAVFVAEKIGLVKLPDVLNYRLVIGTSLLAAIGFTMSLFITTLAYQDEALIYQAKAGILTASLIAGFSGFILLDRVLPGEKSKQLRATIPRQVV